MYDAVNHEYDVFILYIYHLPIFFRPEWTGLIDPCVSIKMLTLCGTFVACVENVCSSTSVARNTRALHRKIAQKYLLKLLNRHVCRALL